MAFYTALFAPANLLSAAGCFLLYVLGLYAYRLLFHPLAKFPGPKLAAISNWYEFYWDVLQHGKFTEHIQALHKQYGPIIRITPTELHIDDPEYYEVLYERNGRRDRYSYFASRFGAATDTFSTIPHELHKNRRKPLNPMFSAQRISQFEPVIRRMVDKLCTKFDDYKKSGNVFLLDRAMMALTTDIITEYAFAKSYNQLDVPNFTETMHDALVAAYVVGHFALHFPIVFPILDSFPDWFTLMVQPVLRPVVGIKRDLAKEVNAIREGMNQGHKQVAHPTIFHELLNGDQPESEKTDARLADEAQLIVAAGLVTTSRALTVGSYHLIANPEIVSKLRNELKNAGVGDKSESFDWHKLEALPYLNGCVHESIRLAHGITTRSPRLAPDEELRYGDYVIAKNTPVSMTTVDILMNEKIYPDPKKFDPERWIDHPELRRYFVPFGKGSRGCMGVNLALAEMYIALARIFSSYDFELYKTDVSDVEMEHAYLVPYPKWESKGVRVKVKQ